MELYKKELPIGDDPAALEVPTGSTNSRYPERSDCNPRIRRPWGTMDMPLNLTKKGYKQWFRARLGAVTRTRRKRVDEMTLDEVQHVLEQLRILRRTTEWCCEELYAQKWMETKTQQSYDDNEGLCDIRALDRWFKFRLGRAEEELEAKFYALTGVGWRPRALPPNPLTEQHGGRVGDSEKSGDGEKVGYGERVCERSPYVFGGHCQHQRPPAECSPSSTAPDASPTSFTVFSDYESVTAPQNSLITLDPPPARLNPQAAGFAMTRSISAGSWSDDDIFIPNIRTVPVGRVSQRIDGNGQEKQGRE